jgi:hypothetical protein
MKIDAIGGYFELELSPHKRLHHSHAIKYQSARASFSALLRTGKPNKVWVPHYICESMLAPLKATETQHAFYAINSDFDIAENIEIGEFDWILYINYYGICNQASERVLKKFPPMQIVMDHSQAFFTPPKDCLATIYSPRKFFGLPDGGLLVSNMPVHQTIGIDQGSEQRTTHLIKRLAGGAEYGYDEYKKAEESLSDTAPLRMSDLTQKLLSGIDFKSAKKRRNENFKYLARKLGGLNELNINLSDIDGPLCYPFLNSKVGIREHLIKNRVFVATYWPDAISRVAELEFEGTLVKKMLPIPCDQRYGINEMEKITNFILNFIVYKNIQ